MKTALLKSTATILTVTLFTMFLLGNINTPTLAAPSASRNISFGNYNLLENNLVTNIIPGTMVSILRSGVTMSNGAVLSFKKPNDTAMSESDILTTGCKLNVTNSIGTAVYRTVIFGDCNNDGVITVGDLSTLKSHLLKISILSGPELESAKSNFGANATISSLIKIKKHVLGIETINQNALPVVNKIIPDTQQAGTATIITDTQDVIEKSAYLAMQGSFINEHFEFKTTIKNGSSPNLTIGARMAGFESNPDKHNGVSIRFYNGFLEVYAPKYGAWVGAIGVTLASNTEYTFGIDVVTLNSTNTLSIVVKQGATTILNYTHNIAAAIPSSGSFVVWSMDETTDISYKLYQYMDKVVSASEPTGTATIFTSDANEVAKAAYLAIQGDFSDEYAEYTINVQDGASPNLVFGARMDGFENNPDKHDGVSLRLYNGFLEVYAPKYGLWKGAATLSLTSNTQYTFKIKVISINEANTLSFVVKQGNITVLDYMLDIGAAIPPSGSFVVWSMNEATEIAYKLHQNISKSIWSSQPSGTATISTTDPDNIAKPAYLALIGNYINGSAEFTTTIKDNTSPNLIFGSRMAGIDNNPDKYNGITLRIYNGFIEVYAPKYGTWVGAVPVTLSSNIEYTFINKVITANSINTLNFVIKQGNTVVLDYYKVIDTQIPASGSFVAWSLNETTDFSYQINLLGDNLSTPNDIPNYSNSPSKLNMYAYVGPTNGVFTNSAGQQFDSGEYRTLLNYQEYKACGFDTLLLLGNDGYSGQPFIGSDLKMNLDLSTQAGLKVIAFDTRIHDLTSSNTALIGTAQFPTFNDLVNTVRNYMTPYMNHPAFLGVALYDEPKFAQFSAVGEVTKAIKAVRSDIFVHTVMLPYFSGIPLSTYTGATSGATTIDSYKTYINSYLDKSNADYFGYDNYPILGSGSTTSVLSTYFLNLQTAVSTSALKSAGTYLTIQSCAMINGGTRIPTEADIRFQTNAALGFGVKNIIYYTYWMFPNRATENYNYAIMDDYGNKLLYYEVKAVNSDMQNVAKVMLNFNYQKAYFTQNGAVPSHFNGVINSNLDNVSNITVTTPTIITQLYDASKNKTGYMVLNANDPAIQTVDNVQLKFDNFSFATCYYNGVPQTVQLNNGFLDLGIAAGEGVFVIPHQ